MNSRTLWSPSPEWLAQANLTHYLHWLEKESGGEIAANYQEAWEWSAQQPASFWESLVKYFDLRWNYNTVIQGKMPHTRWFEGALLNYAEEVFRRADDRFPAIIFQAEHLPAREMSWNELRQEVAALREYLQNLGVQAGDRVVGYLPNIPQATVALLATLSLGAVWSCCSPDFGASSVLERFVQIEPKVLIAVNGYPYGGKRFDRRTDVHNLQAQLSTLNGTVMIAYLDEFVVNLPNCTIWTEIMQNQNAPLSFTPVPFAHPIWVLYSSGTTGLPKAITHSHGGMLLEHLKYLHFHNDVHPGERFFWYTTTGWMMWNFVQAALLSRATIVLYDGSPGYPDLNVLWKIAAELQINHFGTSAAYILSCMKAGVAPSSFGLQHLRSIGVTGSPLPPEGFSWVYENVKSDLWLCSISGGTDVCTAFVGGNPLWPVYVGEIQCRTLGCAMESWDEAGNPLIDQVGEMVITQPMPCMPVKFWNDLDFRKYTASYFDTYPGVWRHGDWLQITPHHSLIILGRSDATLNRQGIRIGTSEIYRSVEKLPEILDSLIVNIEKEDGSSVMPLFVVLMEGAMLDEALQKKIAQTLRTDFSPRHVPDLVIVVAEIPYTLSGKKMELPVKKILMGKSIEQSVNKDAMRNPLALENFKQITI
ncbi:acetoacetate--CoA ligase [Haliscomenobacter sp.]|uniref:acetoacetate--CoA ligase n=1 Tax=Haliscomenobacter sp. TaxID=2717303 RepID=UPI003364CE25